MTVDQAKKRLLEFVKSEVGYHEGNNNYNKYADDKRLAELYGWDAQCQPWCDLFTDYAFIHCFGLEVGAAMTYQPIGGGSAACRTSAQFFKDVGAWSMRPETGDVIFFYVNGAINHQGIVIKVAGGSVVTVEGNSSDAVAERVYQIGASNIAGYGRPNWKAAEDADGPASSDSQEPPSEDAQTQGIIDGPLTDVRLPILRNGMGGGSVAALQGALLYHKCSLGVYGVDGEFGRVTDQAVRNFQIRYTLDVDGVVGDETWKALLK